MSSDERLDRAIASLKQRMGQQTGVDEPPIVAAEKKLGHPFPSPIRQLLERVNAVAWGKFVGGIRLLSPGECGFQNQLFGPQDTAGPYFYFAVGDFGDVIVCDNAGQIVLADHEGGGTPILGETLAEWIERLLTYDGSEYAYFKGSLDDIAPRAARQFLVRHLQLNPWDEWAARKLIEIDYPQGHPEGYLHWDRGSQRLVPVGQLAEALDITMTAPRQRDIDSLVGAKGCRRLMMVRGTVNDLKPLNALKQLTDLYVYDFPIVDARQLADHQSIVDLCFLRCRVDHIDVLAGIPTLKRLRLNECRFDAGQYERFVSSRRDMRLE